jgi:hypothetical protein
MICYNCKIPIIQIPGLCFNCKTDPNISISRTAVKQKYKLTDQEIDKGNIYYFGHVVSKTFNIKYLINEVENLADNLTKNYDPKDKRRLAYLKQKERVEFLRKKARINAEKKIGMLRFVSSIMVKINFVNPIIIMCDEFIMAYITKYSNDVDNIIDFNTTVANIILHLEGIAEGQQQELLRNKKLKKK